MDPLCSLCLVFAMPLCASLYMCLVVTCWERPCGSCLWCLTVSLSLSIGTLGQVWYLIALIPDLCTLTYFNGGQYLSRFKIETQIVMEANK